MEQKVRVLVVDDDPFVAKDLALALKKRGHAPEMAASGQEALEAFRSRTPDLVLLDLRLPDADGLSVLADMRFHSPETPVLVVSGVNDVDEAVRALREGADDYILKPVREKDMLEHAMQRALERASLRREIRLYREGLEEQVRERTRQLETELAERRRTEETLLAREKELQRLAAEMTLAEERERRRIAVGLHDSVGQSLALARMKISTLRGKGEAAGVAEETLEVLDDAIRNVRSLTFQTSDPVLYEIGLEAALGALADRMLAGHGIAWDFQDDRAPKEVSEDVRVLLFQVVRELLHNIVKHARAKHVDLAVRRVGSRLELAVVDDGVGFDPDDVKGRGFGLFSIRERLGHHGISCDITSLPGKGTTVTLSAPLTPLLENTGNPPKGTTRILLVDDHVLFRRGVRSIVEREGAFEVVGEAASGEEAVLLVERLQPDLVLMDVSMQGGSGVEATRSIVRKHPKTKVVALSMHADTRFVTEMLSAGGSGYLLKDCPPEELLRGMHEALSGKRFLGMGVSGLVAEVFVEQERQAQEGALLSPREIEVLRRIANGQNSKEIAAELQLSLKTVETYRERIAEKLELRSTAELTKYALRRGLTSL